MAVMGVRWLQCRVALIVLLAGLVLGAGELDADVDPRRQVLHEPVGAAIAGFEMLAAVQKRLDDWHTHDLS
jgi:hypothetical protein